MQAQTNPFDDRFHDTVLRVLQRDRAFQALANVLNVVSGAAPCFAKVQFQRCSDGDFNVRVPFLEQDGTEAVEVFAHLQSFESFTGDPEFPVDSKFRPTAAALLPATPAAASAAADESPEFTGDFFVSSVFANSFRGGSAKTRRFLEFAFAA